MRASLITHLLVIALMSLPSTSSANSVNCPQKGVQIEILGAGTSDLRGNRTASSYLIWLDGKARVLVGLGPGIARRYRQSGAQFNDLEVILLSHMHGEQTADLAPFVLSTFSDGRKKELPVFGPRGNKFMHSTVAFVRALFDQKRGAFRGLGAVLSPLDGETYKLKPHDIDTRIRNRRLGKEQSLSRNVFGNKQLDLNVIALPVSHKAIPSLAWKIETRGKKLVFGGRVPGQYHDLEQMAENADLLVLPGLGKQVSHGNDEANWNSALVGRVAYRAGVKHLLIDHRGSENNRLEEESSTVIRSKFAGLVRFAASGSCLEP